MAHDFYGKDPPSPLYARTLKHTDQVSTESLLQNIVCHTQTETPRLHPGDRLAVNMVGIMIKASGPT